MRKFLLLLGLVGLLIAQEKSSGRAMLYSLLIPGGGQFYTENYLKGVVIGGAQATLEYLAVRDHLRALDCLARTDTLTYVRYRDSRNNLLWWSASVLVFSLADAYVSAHMYRFKEEERLTFVVSPWRIGIAAAW